jgi:tRNA(Ile)-lysidine synthase
MARTRGLTPLQRSVLERAAARLPQEPLVVALSGGADSAVCAWAAVAAGRTVRAVTVNHGLPVSGPLVEAAGKVAAALGLEHSVVEVVSDDSEAALRVARYRALESEAAAGEVLLSGHTSDDQAETVLGNLVRGSGASGLAGIPVERPPWLRPLLEVSRAEARQVADELGLPYADDPSNLDVSLRRNELRHEVIPYLEERFGSAVRERLARAAAFLAADDTELERRALAVPLRLGGDAVRMPAAALVMLPMPVAARVVRRALRSVLSPYPGSRRDVEAVLEVASGTADRISLSGDNIASREGPWVAVHPVADPVAPEPVPLAVPGTARFGDWVIDAELLPGIPVPAPLGRRHAFLEPVGGPLMVRAAGAGDTVAMVEGSKEVAEALREAGVPARLRRSWPVVERDGTIIWVVSVRAAADAGPGEADTLMLTAREVG